MIVLSSNTLLVTSQNVWIMKALFIKALGIIVLAISCGAALRAQCDIHPDDPDALLHGTLSVHIAIHDACIISCDVCAWRTTSGQLDLVIDHNSIYLHGDCKVMDSIPSAQIFNLLDLEAISAGIRMQYLLCGKSCEKPQTARIYRTSCVRIEGEELNRKFRACINNHYNVHSYRYCCPPNDLTGWTVTPAGVLEKSCPFGNDCQNNSR